MTDKWIIYTDGGCTGNPGPGGWAAVFLQNGQVIKELSGGAESTTNNRMELTAVIKALEWLIHNNEALTGAEIHTDSQYVQKGITEWMKGWIAKGWKTAAKKPVKNKDLWMHLNTLNRQVKLNWYWVKGHAGNEWNERCDELVGVERRRNSYAVNG